MTRALRAVHAALLMTTAAVLAGCENPAAPSVKVDFTINDLQVGAGAEATDGRFVLVNYAGWLYNGTEPDKKGKLFDASLPGRPFEFWLGQGAVIDGWERGVPGMRVGGTRRLIIPASLAYGRTGAGRDIPPNASLVFDIELISVF